MQITLNENTYTELLRLYRDKPVEFMREVCILEPYAWQVRFLEALKTDKFFARPSGHGTGKTTVLAVGMLWMLLVWEDCHIRCTSATYDQLKTVMWNTFKQIVYGSAVSSWVEIDESKAVNKAFPNHWARPLAWSKDKPQAWAGEHCKHPVGVFDECSDIDDSIFEAWHGSSHHEGSRTVLLGQPRMNKGKLYEAAKDPKYNVEHLSSEDIPGQAEFCLSSASDYGRESDMYRVRVQGLFPNSDNACLFPNADMKRLEQIEPTAEMTVAGLDLAGNGGDETVLVVMRGNAVIALHKFSFTADVKLSQERQVIVDTLKRYGCNMLAMDTNGIGDGLGKYMQELPNFTLVPVVGSETARNDRKYHNRRAEAFGALADIWQDLRFAKDSMSAETLKELAEQLTAIRMFYDKQMRIQILLKKDIKKELKNRSPDSADALAYASLCAEAKPYVMRKVKLTPEILYRDAVASNPFVRYNQQRGAA